MSEGGPVRERPRHDLDSRDARAVLEEDFGNPDLLIYKESELTTPAEKIEGAAGKASRMINDYNAGPFTWVDVDTEEERRRCGDDGRVEVIGLEDFCRLLRG